MEEGDCILLQLGCNSIEAYVELCFPYQFLPCNKEHISVFHSLTQGSQTILPPWTALMCGWGGVCAGLGGAVHGWEGLWEGLCMSRRGMHASVHVEGRFVSAARSWQGHGPGLVCGPGVGDPCFNCLV